MNVALHCGLSFPAYGSWWKIVNYSTGDDLWLVQNCFDSSFIDYWTEKKILDNFKIALDKNA